MENLPKYKYQVGTKYITSQALDSPQLKNEYGSLNSFLKIVLTEGFNLREVTSVLIEFEQTTMKINLPINHGYYVDQIVIMEGAEQSVFNKEYRVLDYGVDYITVLKPETMLTNVSTSTELTIKVAPLGYTIPYENEEEGVICFKNKSLKSPAILKVIDKLPPNGYESSWAKYGRVVIGQHLDEFGNFIRNTKAPFHPDFPEAEKTGNGVSGAPGVHGFAKWEYSIYPNSYETRENITANGIFPTDWKIIGDDKTFYLMIRSQGKNKFNYNLLGYGNYVSDNAQETSNVCLQAKDGFMSADSSNNYSFSRTRNFFGALNSSYSGFILKDIYDNHATGYNRSSLISNLIIDSTHRNRPWNSTSVKSINPVSGKRLTGYLYIKDYENYLRGFHRGIQIPYGTSRLPEGFIDDNGYLYLEVQEPVHTSTDTKAPIIFSLNDWEPVL